MTEEIKIEWFIDSVRIYWGETAGKSMLANKAISKMKQICKHQGITPTYHTKTEYICDVVSRRSYYEIIFSSNADMLGCRLAW